MVEGGKDPLLTESKEAAKELWFKLKPVESGRAKPSYYCMPGIQITLTQEWNFLEETSRRIMMSS